MISQAQAPLRNVSIVAVLAGLVLAPGCGDSGPGTSGNEGEGKISPRFKALQEAKEKAQANATKGGRSK